MKINLPQLTDHLATKLAPFYWISGDETLLVDEAIQSIRDTAEKKGFLERERLSIESPDWTAQSLSLFSEKRIIELDLFDAKLTPSHTKTLQEIAAKPPVDTLYIVKRQKMDSKSQQSAWFKNVEKNAVFIQVWPMTQQQLPTWIMQRAKKIGATISPATSQKLAAFCEGNLLAAAQAIEKLRLGNNEAALFEDQTHFDIYQLVESALAGNNARSLKILNNLQAEGAEPVLVLWTLTNEVRLLNTLAKETKKGTPLSSLFSQYKIWEKRQGPMQQFLRRKKQTDCWDLLTLAAETDRIIKGIESDNAWESLQRLALKFA